MKLRNTVALISFVLLCAAALTAQTHTGSARGILTDPRGAVISGATVTLTSVETGETRTTASNGEGEYIISSLRPGLYRLEIAAGGFETFQRPVELQVNQERRIDVQLEPAGTVEYIDVTDELAPLKKDSASLGAVIENRQVTGLPLDGRNFYELNLLVPGAVPAAQGSAGSVRGDFAFSVNGAREDSNNFLLDGVYNVDPKLNTFGVRPPVDAIREFEMLTSTYDASFGRNAGAQVNVVLKSGSNDFHGSLYEFHRNGALDARNYFAPATEPAPKYLRNQFGFSLGGPLARNRTFFFADYEGTRSREGITRLARVPTLRERAGDFSQSGFVVIDPLTFQPFPGNVIPENRQSAIGQRIAALYPAPNRNDPFQNFVSSPVQRDRNDSFDIRLDHSLSGSSNLVFRYSFNDRDLFEPFSGPTFSPLPGYGVNVPRRGQNVMLGETHVFTPALVNEARFAFNRVSQQVIQEGRGTSVNRQVGLPEL
ncbi:MAG TPA: carboxypeptidase-like regulatory domain-containing protein, partial [Pyrinomonadaceae bacterium]|nr:carboxypeptidase-like regulatory domain-containing protein [Pyrinomonadaceae bacterium]